MGKQEASYTIELALLLPVILLTMFLPIHAGYHLYCQGKELSACGWDGEFCPDEKVRKLKFAGEIWEELK